MDFPSPVDAVRAPSAQVQRPQPAAAPRPGLGCGRGPTTWRRPRRAVRPGGRAGGQGDDITGCGRRSGASVSRLPRPRGPCPLGRAVVQARPDPDPAAPDGAAHQHGRPAVRPRVRGADALGYLDRATVTDRGQRLIRIYSDLDLVAAEALRPASARACPPGFAAALSVLVFEARRPDDDAPRVPAARPGRPSTSSSDLRALQTWRRAPAGLHPATRSRLRVGDVPLGGGRRPRRGAERPRWSRAGRRRLRPVDEAGHRPRRPGGRRGRRRPGPDSARDVVRALRRGVVAYTAVE